jgi:hypothetical protein
LKRKSVFDFSYGDSVIVVSLEPERFLGGYQDTMKILNKTHPWLGMSGIVDHIDERVKVVWVLLKNGKIEPFTISEIDKQKKES